MFCSREAKRMLTSVNMALDCCHLGRNVEIGFDRICICCLFTSRLHSDVSCGLETPSTALHVAICVFSYGGEYSEKQYAFLGERYFYSCRQNTRHDSCEETRQSGS